MNGRPATSTRDFGTVRVLSRYQDTLAETLTSLRRRLLALASQI